MARSGTSGSGSSQAYGGPSDALPGPDFSRPENTRTANEKTGTKMPGERPIATLNARPVTMGALFAFLFALPENSNAATAVEVTASNTFIWVRTAGFEPATPEAHSISGAPKVRQPDG